MWTALRGSAWMCGSILLLALDACSGGGSSGPVTVVPPLSALAPASCTPDGIAVVGTVITICTYNASDTYTATSSNAGITLVRSSPSTFTIVGNGVAAITVAWTNGIDTSTSTFTVCENVSNCEPI
jgi:hypothetical protein